MGCRVVLVGGGSYSWTPRLATDLFLKEGLRCGTLVLVGLDEAWAETATVIQQVLQGAQR